MALDFLASVESEISALISSTDGLGVDGIFADCSITAAQWLIYWQAISAPPASSASGVAGSRERGQVKPIAAVSVFVIVGVLVLLCVVWVVVHKKTGEEVGAPYKEVKPRFLDGQFGEDYGSHVGTLELGTMGMREGRRESSSFSGLEA